MAVIAEQNVVAAAAGQLVGARSAREDVGERGAEIFSKPAIVSPWASPPSLVLCRIRPRRRSRPAVVERVDAAAALEIIATGAAAITSLPPCPRWSRLPPPPDSTLAPLSPTSTSFWPEPKRLEAPDLVALRRCRRRSGHCAEVHEDTARTNSTVVSVSMPASPSRRSAPRPPPIDSLPASPTSGRCRLVAGQELTPASPLRRRPNAEPGTFSMPYSGHPRPRRPERWSPTEITPRSPSIE